MTFEDWADHSNRRTVMTFEEWLQSRDLEDVDFWLRSLLESAWDTAYKEGQPKWQSMENAPRDGTEMVVITGHNEKYIVSNSEPDFLGFFDNDGWEICDPLYFIPLPQDP